MDKADFLYNNLGQRPHRCFELCFERFESIVKFTSEGGPAPGTVRGVTVVKDSIDDGCTQWHDQNIIFTMSSARQLPR